MPIRDKILQHQGEYRKAAGPDVARIPGSLPSDYTWDPTSLQWEFNSSARPGQVFVGQNTSLSKSGKSGWIPTSDYKEPGHGLFGGWTKGQLLALGGIGAAAAAGPLIGAFAGGGGGGAAATGAATLPSTSYAGAATLPTVAGAGSTAATAGGGSTGIMSTIGRILGVGGTKGGTASRLGTILDVAGKVAPILTNAAGGRAAGEAIENNNLLSRDQLNQSAAVANNNAGLSAANLDLNRRQFALDAPGTRLSTSVKGSMASRAHNVKVGSGDPITLSSGRSITPIRYSGVGPDDLLNSNTRALGEKITEDELHSQMAGDKFDPYTPGKVPGASAPNTGGVMDNVLGTSGLATSVAGAFSPAIQAILDKAKRGTAQASGTEQQMGLL